MMELLSEKEIADDYVLGKIIRYNHRCKLQDESVATHSFFVSLFCLKIMSRYKVSHKVERDVLILATLHDTPESRTSDIPHDVKINYPKMQEILDIIEKDYYQSHWKEYYDSISNPSELVLTIVKLADAYSVYQYCLNENTLGNSSDEIEIIRKDALERILRYTERLDILSIKD